MTTTLAKHYPTESMATVEDMMVLRYRYLLEQCYRYFALPIIVLDKVRQLAVAIVNTAHKHVGLDKVLATVQSFAFRNSNYPVILNLQLAKDFDQFEVLRAALEDNLASYNTLQGEFTPKQMTNKVLVYFTVVPQQQDFEHLVVGNLLAKGGEQNGQLEVDVDNFEDLYANKDKCKCLPLFSPETFSHQDFRCLEIDFSNHLDHRVVALEVGPGIHRKLHHHEGEVQLLARVDPKDTRDQ